MAITIDYGDIGSALGLAKKAGQNQGDQQRFQNYLAFQNQVQQSQNEMDRNSATQIQHALAVNQLGEHYAVSEDQIHQQGINAQAQQSFQNKSLAQTGKFQDAQIDLGQQRVDNQVDQTAATVDQKEARAQRDQQTAAIAQSTEERRQNALLGNDLTPQEKAQAAATGRINRQPATMQQDRQMQDLGRETSALNAQMRQADTALKAAAFAGVDSLAKGMQESTTVPGAVQGKEKTFQAAQKIKLAAAQRLQEIQAMMQQHNTPPPQPTKTAAEVPPAPDVQPPQQQAPQGQQSAPAQQQPRIVQTATNPKTGEKMGFDQSSGQWVKM